MSKKKYGLLGNKIVRKSHVWGEANGPDHSDYYEAADIYDANTGKYIGTDYYYRYVGKRRRSSWFSRG